MMSTDPKLLLRRLTDLSNGRADLLPGTTTAAAFSVDIQASGEAAALVADLVFMVFPSRGESTKRAYARLVDDS